MKAYEIEDWDKLIGKSLKLSGSFPNVIFCMNIISVYEHAGKAEITYKQEIIYQKGEHQGFRKAGQTYIDIRREDDIIIYDNEQECLDELVNHIEREFEIIINENQ